jgi:DNA repair exonuclease SbcCD nuclease subunit
MNTLYLGDPHIKISNMEESERLLSFVSETAIKYKISKIVILGDLHNNHATVRVEIVNFWIEWLEHLSSICETIVLVGNHDQVSHDENPENALSMFNDPENKSLKIVEHGTIDGIFGYMPYMHDNTKLIDVANNLVSLGARVIVFHGTVNGAKYDNGFYAPDGLNAELINCDHLISGHVHARQRFVTSSGQEVIYPGTARWDGNDDANAQKGLWLVEHDPMTGKRLREEFLDTSHVCRPLIKVQWIEGQPVPAIPPNARMTIELVGTSEWISKEKAQLKGKVSIQTKVTDKDKARSRKAGESLEHFISNYFQPTTGHTREDVLRYMKELNLV